MVWWETRHVVKADLPANNSTIRVTETPPDVRITGYVLLNSAYGSTKFCKKSVVRAESITMGLNR